MTWRLIVSEAIRRPLGSIGGCEKSMSERKVIAT